MAYLNCFFHYVFRTKGSLRVLDGDAVPALYRFIGSVSENLGCHIHMINGMSDHIHIAVEMPADVSPSDYMREVKGRSSRWITERRLFCGFQGWGRSYFGSTFSKKDLQRVVNYISNQQVHHQKVSLREELESFFESAGLSEKFRYFVADD